MNEAITFNMLYYISWRKKKLLYFTGFSIHSGKAIL